MTGSSSSGLSSSNDWRAERDRIDLVAVVTAMLGPAPGRRGGNGGKLWWSCPLGTHEDRNPSFCVEPGRRFWKCFGCGEKGDAASLIMKLENVTFPQAAAILSGNATSSARPPARATWDALKRSAAPPIPLTSTGLTPEDAVVLVEASAARIWEPEYEADLAYLTGPARGLSRETIREARVGVTPEVVSLPEKASPAPGVGS